MAMNGRTRKIISHAAAGATSAAVTRFLFVFVAAGM